MSQCLQEMQRIDLDVNKDVQEFDVVRSIDGNETTVTVMNQKFATCKKRRDDTKSFNLFLRVS